MQACVWLGSRGKVCLRNPFLTAIGRRCEKHTECRLARLGRFRDVGGVMRPPCKYRYLSEDPISSRSPRELVRPGDRESR